MVEAVKPVQVPDIEIDSQPSISIETEKIRGPITFPYSGREMTCLGRSKENGTHSKECQERISDARKRVKRDLIRTLRSVIIGKL